MLIWFPIKTQEGLAEFHAALRALGIPKILAVTLLLTDPAQTPNKLNGCGMLIVNPPFALASELETFLPWLYQAMVGDHEGGGGQCFWLTPER